MNKYKIYYSFNENNNIDDIFIDVLSKELTHYIEKLYSVKLKSLRFQSVFNGDKIVK